MKIIFNRYIPFKGFEAINLFGILFVRGNCRPLSNRLINHEKIHSAQIKELAFIFFYIIYAAEWLYRLTKRGSAYRQLTFEREAYTHESDSTYLPRRPRYAMWRRPEPDPLLTLNK